MTMNARTVVVSEHAERQAVAKGWTRDDIIAAVDWPDTQYPSMKYPGQVRMIKGDLCVVCDPAANRVVTVYKNVVETPLRPDQIARGDKIRGRR